MGNNGISYKEVDPEVSSRVEYLLTEFVETLEAMIVQKKECGEKYKSRVMEKVRISMKGKVYSLMSPIPFGIELIFLQ
ncbi:hypothetical protein [Bacillus cereus]|uniref:hypothetical protein n=1 Tax=Bacillus cereus TaxID=1396 RepID=UPI00396F6FA0